MTSRNDKTDGALVTLDEPAGTLARGKPMPAQGKAGPAGPADWTVLAYVAGDNDLEDELLGDLREMERIGSRPGSVEILAQVDRTGAAPKGAWRGTRRYYVTRGPASGATGSKLLADLGATNTGDPRVLKDFLSFGAKDYAARATLLVLSNHGSGFYVPPEMLSSRGQTQSSRPGTPAGGTQGLPGRARRRVRLTPGPQRTLFHPTRQSLLGGAARGILYDDGSGDCLDNRELQQVLAHAHRALRRPVDLVGMDACLMTMLEVAYQLRDHARILVGSEEVEPGAGWPYTAVLGDLVARPAMTAPELAATIVRRYAESYAGEGEDATQSAIDLGKLDDLVAAVDGLAKTLLGALPGQSLELALYIAWRRTLRFFDHLYADLHHFAVNLAAATTRRDVRQAALEVRRAIEAEGGPILAEQHDGRRMAPARGLSIYLPPFRDRSVFYGELEFARRTRWADFLEAYLGDQRKTTTR